MRSVSIRPALRTGSVLCTALTLTLALAAPGAVEAQPDPVQTREQLRPLYQQLRTDTTFQALKMQLHAHPGDDAVLDRLLRYLPISPLEYLRLDMEANRYEFAIPKLAHDWHRRWVELHPESAMELYGRTYVDALLRGPAAGIAGAAGEPELSLRATVGTNRNAAATFGPNPPTEYQGEIQVVVNPNDPNQIVAASNTWDDGMQSVFYSSDGGVTWGHTFPPLGSSYPGFGSCSATEFGSDPALYWNDSGEVFLEYLALCSSIFSTDYSVVVSKSTDGGANWSAQGVVVNAWGTGNLEDKQFYIIDNHPGSPFYGRHYTCWDRNNDERFAYSTDGGANWTEVNLPNVAIDLGCEMAVADDGTVHLVWDTLNCGASCSNERMFYTRSTNGGVSWSSPVLVRDFNLVGFSGANCPDPQDNRCIGPFGAIDVDNTGGPCDGTLYATFTDFTSGGVNESDVWLTRSTNNGANWSAPLKVNDDGLAGRAQFHPFLVVDPSNGHVVVGWHDARNDPGNDAIDYFVARSLDCGLSFEPNVQVSQASAEFNNDTISYSNENTADNPSYNPNQYGEYMGVDARGGKAYLAWSDTRHFFPGSTGEAQQENVGFAVVDFGGGSMCGNGILEPGEACDSPDLGGATCADVGCTGGSPACTGTCTLDYSGCTGCGGGCDNDGVCESGEDCNTCPNDCVSGAGASCGNGICEAADGEDCLTCAADCNGKQNGNPGNRFCCGNGGQNPVGCADSRCTTGGFQCTTSPATASCCGDAVCEGIEDGFNCELDCGPPPFCGDAVCDPGEDPCSCAADCGSPLSSELFCDNGEDDDCDGFTDCADSDCDGTAACPTCQPVGGACTVDGDCCSLDCRGKKCR